ncbi:MAG TPA: ABC transporter substrate-binding protein [Candidatus Methylomirabilis sp.]|nr:ABC transporter substrate-binding protein [Candidatus Methylomirabilis sp.]
MLRCVRILGVAVIALAVALAWAPTGAPAAKAEVRWLQWKTTEVGEKLMNELKAAFEKEHPDITLTLVDSPFTGFHDKAITLFQAQKLADVLMVQVDWVAEYADLGMLEPLDGWLLKEPKEFLANIPAAFQQKWRGKQYYLPLHSGCVALYWNTEIFKSAGIPGPPKTWDEYVQIARKVTNPEKKIFATTATLQIEPPTNMTYDIYPLILQAGGDILDEKANKAAFNSPAGVKAIEWYVDLVNKHKVAVPGVLSNGEKEKRANFGAGNIAMMFEGPWGVAIQKNLNPNLKYDTAPLPKGMTTGTVVRGALDTMTTQAQNKEAAWKFLRWISGPVGNEMWAKGTGDFPGRKDVAEKPFFKENKLAQAFVQQMQQPNAKSPFLGMPNAVQMNKIMTTEVQNVVQGKKAAKQALDDAAAEWNKILAK